MYRFSSLINAGASVAAISDVTDGDCGLAGIADGNRDRFLVGAGVANGTLNTLRQVHGCHVHQVGDNRDQNSSLPSNTPIPEGDSHFAASPGQVLGITVADCVPILLFDPQSRAVAAVHAGRAGTARGIVTETIARLQSVFDVAPANIRAAIGPSAGPCCYEVSQALSDECASRGLVVCGRYVDLWESNQNQLLNAGVKSVHIEDSCHCTICNGGYFSYRLGDQKARNLAIIQA
jgi:polyphenol oxidase